MDELKVIYGIITSLWQLAKRYGYRSLTDAEWEEFVQYGMDRREEFLRKGEEFDLLWRDLFAALQRMYIRRSKEKDE